VIGALLELVEEEMLEHQGRVQGEYVKFGAAVALAVCASLRGPEVFLFGFGWYVEAHRYREGWSVAS